MQPRWISDLLDVSAAHAPLSRADIEELGCMLLSYQDDGKTPRFRSTLNNDGTSLQLCFSTSPSKIRTRLIGDPAAHVEDPTLRYQRGLAALDGLLRRTRSLELKNAIERLLALTLPKEPLPKSMIWIGAALGDPGIALYTASRFGDLGERWPRAFRWFDQLLPREAPAFSHFQKLPPWTMLASCGLEGSSPKDARAKIYFRFGDTPLPKLGVPLFADPDILLFLQLVLGERLIAREGIVCSLGASLASGQMVDAKVDVCGHCLRLERGEWQQLLWQLEETFGLKHLPGELVADERIDVAFVGFAVDVEGSSRLNLYLKAKERRP